MRRARSLVALAWLVGGLLSKVPAAGQDDLTLTTACEAGFRRFIQLAQSGRLGDDVSNANVGVIGNQVRVELVRSEAPATVFLLTPKRTTQAVSRYFEVVPSGGATAEDVARVGRVLDEVFPTDPFQITGFEGSPTGDVVPGLVAAWSTDGWRAALRVLERRMVVLASLAYTVGVIVVLALASLAGIALMWGSMPSRPSPESTRW